MLFDGSIQMWFFRKKISIFSFYCIYIQFYIFVGIIVS